MTEQMKRRGRLATALIAGPAVTVGMLGAGAAPVMAQDDVEPDPQEASEEEVVSSEEDGGAEDESGAADDDESEADGDSDDDSGDDDAEEGDAEEEAADSEDSDEDVDPADIDEPETETGGFQTFNVTAEEDGDDVEVGVDGSVVTISNVPDDAVSITVNAASGESTGAGSPDEEGNLSFDASEYIDILALEPGENTLTFSWTTYEDNEPVEDSVDATVTLEEPDQDEVNWAVDNEIVTGTGFPESVLSITVEADGQEASAGFPDEEGVLTVDTASLVDQLDLGWGEQTLTFSWEWTDEFGEQSDSAEVTVTPIPPLETGEDISAEEIINGMIGDDTSIQGIETIGQGVQMGQFSGWDALGIPAGVVLSTGNLLESWATVTGRGFGSISTGLDGDGDADLDEILEGTGPDFNPNPETNDAAGLEFSFIPDTNYVQFSYVFASEEYYQDHPGSFNDIFAFLVNGENYAVFESEDGETLPVAINTINREVNSDLYNDNEVGEDGETPYDSGVRGFTNVLTFTAPVTPGEVNTLKLVVGDTQDDIYDSLVFLQGGSFEQIQGPVVTGGEFATEQGEAISEDFNLQTTTEDPEWSIEVTDGIDEEAGELEIDGTSWTFTPADDFTGEASFTVTANDGALTTVPATITITVGDEDSDDDEDDDEGTTPPEDPDDPEDPADEDDAPSEDEPSVELTVDNDEVAAGDQVTVVGEGFEAGEDVDFDLNPELGTFPADDEGVVTAEVTIPEDTEPGEYSITATGQSSELSGSVSITVVEPTEVEPAGAADDQEVTADADQAPAAADQGEELAATGMSGRDAGLASALLLLVGGGLAALGYKNRLGRRDADI